MNLNKKWWHRLIKVIFVLAIFASVSITTILLVVEYKPEVDRYRSTYEVSCLNFDTTFGTVKGSDTNWDYSLKDTGGETQAISFCANQGSYEKYKSIESKEERITFMNSIFPFNSFDKNYELIATDEVIEGSWLEMFGYILIAIISYFIFFSLIRYIYFYIVKNEHKYLFNERNKKN